MPESIGLIGLGLMGAAFTKRLLDLGHRVVAFDIDAAKVAAAQSLGASSAASAKDVASQCQTILVCVISTAAVRDVALGERGIVHGATDGTVVVDFSTTVVADTVDIAQQLKAASGAGWVDAPVSGGPPAAATGSLAIMAGGTDEDIVRVTSLLNSMASTFTHMGGVGAGQTTKMVNQILVLNNYVVLAEACALAKAGGIDVEKIPEALGSGYAGSNLMKAMFPRMVAKDFAPAGYARQVLKDLDMVQDLARQLGVPTPMSSEAASLFRVLVSKGHAELDGIAIYKLLAPDETV